jgi:hypothetical protein
MFKLTTAHFIRDNFSNSSLLFVGIYHISCATDYAHD